METTILSTNNKLLLPFQYFPISFYFRFFFFLSYYFRQHLQYYIIEPEISDWFLTSKRNYKQFTIRYDIYLDFQIVFIGFYNENVFLIVSQTNMEKH